MMTGKVDDYGRALLPIKVGHPADGTEITLDAWLDTAFTGALLLTQAQTASLGLVPAGALPGGLADGSSALFGTFPCMLGWFGGPRVIEALAGNTKFALIGVQLLEDCTLVIDYPARKVTLAGFQQP